MTGLNDRLGLNVHRDQWPTRSHVIALEAAGFGWAQVHTPPGAMLADRERCRRHARALRAVFETTSLRLLVHGPDDLRVGTIEHDRAFEGLLEYAVEAHAELVVYHGLNHPLAEGAGAARIRERALAEVRSLQRFADQGETLGVTIAVENLAPMHPGPPLLCHDPWAVRDLVRRLNSPAVGVLLDIGHAHIVASLRRESLLPAIRAVMDDVVLFHVHDNLGARHHDVDVPGVDPLKLDLHLPPGAGALPWDRVIPLLRDHHAPLMLEVERSHAPAPSELHAIARALLERPAAPAAA